MNLIFYAAWFTIVVGNISRKTMKDMMNILANFDKSQAKCGYQELQTYSSRKFSSLSVRFLTAKFFFLASARLREVTSLSLSLLPGLCQVTGFFGSILSLSFFTPTSCVHFEFWSICNKKTLIRSFSIRRTRLWPCVWSCPGRPPSLTERLLPGNKESLGLVRTDMWNMWYDQHQLQLCVLGHLKIFPESVQARSYVLPGYVCPADCYWLLLSPCCDTMWWCNSQNLLLHLPPHIYLVICFISKYLSFILHFTRLC